ncbi:hypothetical protein QOT17_012591 [Balamuthia mandrillaris]
MNTTARLPLFLPPGCGRASSQTTGPFLRAGDLLLGRRHKHYGMVLLPFCSRSCTPQQQQLRCYAPPPLPKRPKPTDDLNPQQLKTLLKESKWKGGEKPRLRPHNKAERIKQEEHEAKVMKEQLERILLAEDMMRLGRRATPEEREQYLSVYYEWQPGEQERILQQTKEWVERAVIGLDLCPLARESMASTEYFVSSADSPHAIERDLRTLRDKLLDSKLSGILMVVPIFEQFRDFFTFDAYVSTLQVEECDERLQLAKFHPKFAHSHKKKFQPNNFANRSPYPIIHLLKSSAMLEAENKYGEEYLMKITPKNRERLDGMGLEEVQRYFHFIRVAGEPDNPFAKSLHEQLLDERAKRQEEEEEEDDEEEEFVPEVDKEMQQLLMQMVQQSGKEGNGDNEKEAKRERSQRKKMR